jgi:ubiquitin carboxyl-terminal hydrolase 8
MHLENNIVQHDGNAYAENAAGNATENANRIVHKGLTGLENLGNTCFLNSCVQVLARIPAFDKLMEEYRKHINLQKDEYFVLKEFEDLRKMMLENQGVICPKRFVFFVHLLAKQKERHLFTGWFQNDIAEFLLFFMECVHEATCRPITMEIQGSVNTSIDRLAHKCFNELKQIYEKEYSPFMDAFYGIYFSQIVDIHPPHTELSVKPEHFFILDVPIPVKLHEQHRKIINVYDCIDYYCQNEVLSGENAWKNGENENQDVMKRIRFWNFPRLLVITLKRFDATGRRKLQNHIDFPVKNLDLRKYVDGYNPNKYVYDLYGICNHMGGIQGGHYTAYVYHKNILGGVWLHHNDTQIELVKEDKLVTNYAYCLFYHMRGDSGRGDGTAEEA